MSQHSFSLTTIGMTPGRALVKLDGEDISDAVRGVGLDFSAKDHPRVMLELADISADVAVDDVEIQLPQKTVALLQRLGWKTPEKYEALRDRALAVVKGGVDGPYDEANPWPELREGHPATISGEALAALRDVLVEQGQLGSVPTSDEPASEGPSGAVGESIT